MLRNGLNGIVCVAMFLGLGLACRVPAAERTASASRGISVSLYANGKGFVTERRTVPLQQGMNTVVFTGLPAQLYPGTVSIVSSSGKAGFEEQSFSFRYDGSDPLGLMKRHEGQQVTVVDGAQSWSGTLQVMAPVGDMYPCVLNSVKEGLVYIPDVQAVDVLTLHGAALQNQLAPMLYWRTRTDMEGVGDVRISYMTGGLSWLAAYDLVLPEGDQGTADLSVRISLKNQTDLDLEDARVRLLFSGSLSAEPGDQDGLIYLQGVSEPVPGSIRVNSRADGRMDLPEGLDVPAHTETHVLVTTARIPLQHIYVYDGVKFDRYKRNPRTDWSYGTDYQSEVEMQVSFMNSERNGLGRSLPQGALRLYTRQTDGRVDWVGEDLMPATGVGKTARIRLSNTPDLRGERERIGYREVIPLRSYEESFEIRLENNSDEDRVIHVVEHLYRGDQYEIVKSDLEYTETEPSVIEFLPEVKAGGRRSLHYTVRYNW